MYMDTDSSYMALSDDFGKLIKLALRKEFEKDKINWFPRTDTNETKHLTNENPAYLKKNMLEMVWQHYVVRHIIAWIQKIKFSCKGTQQSRNMNILTLKRIKVVYLIVKQYLQ